jgi:hypothetical protein
VNPRPSRIFRLYRTVWARTAGRSRDSGRTPRVAALTLRARRRRSLSPAWSNQVRTLRCQSLWKWLLWRTKHRHSVWNPVNQTRSRFRTVVVSETHFRVYELRNRELVKCHLKLFDRIHRLVRHRRLWKAIFGERISDGMWIASLRDLDWPWGLLYWGGQAREILMSASVPTPLSNTLRARTVRDALNSWTGHSFIVVWRQEDVMNPCLVLVLGCGAPPLYAGLLLLSSFKLWNAPQSAIFKCRAIPYTQLLVSYGPSLKKLTVCYRDLHTVLQKVVFAKIVSRVTESEYKQELKLNHPFRTFSWPYQVHGKPLSVKVYECFRVVLRQSKWISDHPWAILLGYPPEPKTSKRAN